MEALLTAIDKLQEMCGLLNDSSGVLFPQIVVMGRQSAGKSSVLEFIAGRDLLPKGSKGMTSCPVILHLKRTQEELFEFQHQIHSNLATLRTAVESEMQKIFQEEGKSVSSQSIHVTLGSPRTPDLLLVDLPGLTDPPHPNAALLRDLTMEYITQPNTLILPILQASGDALNVPVLAVAHSADPSGERTIAVFTKLDLLDRNIDVLEIMEQSAGGLPLGYVAVLCRSPTDMKMKVTIAQHRRVERSFFRCHLKNGAISDMHGIDQFLRKVAKFLHGTIVKKAQKVKQDMENEERSITAQMKRYKAAPPESAQEQSRLICAVLDTYRHHIEQALNGSSDSTHLRTLLNDSFEAQLQLINPLLTVSDEELTTVIANARGFAGSIFLPQMVLELVVKYGVPYMRSECLNCVDSVHSALRTMSRNMLDMCDLERFPALCGEIKTVVDDFLQSGRTAATDFTQDLLEIQAAHLDLQHTDFIGATPALISVIQTSDSSHPPHTRQIEARVLRTLSDSYFQIVRRTLKDVVSKAVVCFLITPFKEELYGKLVSGLIRTEKLQALLLEEGQEKRDREACQVRVTNLIQAQATLIQLQNPDLY